MNRQYQYKVSLKNYNQLLRNLQNMLGNYFFLPHSVYIYILPAWIDTSQWRGQPLVSFLSTFFDHGHAVRSFFNPRDFVSCCIVSPHRFFGRPCMTAASVDLCRPNSFRWVLWVSFHSFFSWSCRSFMELLSCSWKFNWKVLFNLVCLPAIPFVCGDRKSSPACI